MCKVIAICNQKGGVSKTTTTANLGVGLVGAGKEVLVIDADPQGNLSQSLGIKNPDELEVALPSIMEQIIMDKEVDVTKGIIHHKEGLDLMPCNIDLSGVDVSLVNAMTKSCLDCHNRIQGVLFSLSFNSHVNSHNIRIHIWTAVVIL